MSDIYQVFCPDSLEHHDVLDLEKRRPNVHLRLRKWQRSRVICPNLLFNEDNMDKV